MKKIISSLALGAFLATPFVALAAPEQQNPTGTEETPGKTEEKKAEPKAEGKKGHGKHDKKAPPKAEAPKQ